MTGAILVIGLTFPWLPPCSGMDALTQSELNELSGRAGITMAFSSPATVEARFNSLGIGDTDGWGAIGGQNDNPGWLVLIGTGANTGYLRSTIPANAVMTFDVGTTGGTSCPIAGAAPYAGILIPANTPFFSFSLTEAIIGLQTPTTVNIKLTSGATLAAGSMESVGFMRAQNLMIEKDNIKSTCYIWVHP